PSAAVNRSAINRIMAPSSASSVLASAASRSIARRIAASEPGMSPRSRHAIASRRPARTAAIAGRARSPITISSSPRFCASLANGSSAVLLSGTAGLFHRFKFGCKAGASRRTQSRILEWRCLLVAGTGTRCQHAAGREDQPSGNLHEVDATQTAACVSARAATLPAQLRLRARSLILRPCGGLRAVACCDLIDCGAKIRGDLGVTETRLLLILYRVAVYRSIRWGNHATSRHSHDQRSEDQN